jgi:hypothetical protein
LINRITDRSPAVILKLFPPILMTLMLGYHSRINAINITPLNRIFGICRKWWNHVSSRHEWALADIRLVNPLPVKILFRYTAEHLVITLPLRILDDFFSVFTLIFLGVVFDFPLALLLAVLFLPILHLSREQRYF